MSNDLNNAIAHAVLSLVASNGLHGWSQHGGHNYANFGMHSNFFIHGILGIFHHQSNVFKLDVKQLFDITTKATKFLALPCLNADLYRHHEYHLGLLHLASGVIPFVLSLQGKEDENLCKLVLALNIVSLGYFSFDRKLESGYYTVGAAIFAYFCANQVGDFVYPLGLALTDYCAFRIGFW